jgi:hypothetical protein
MMMFRKLKHAIIHHILVPNEAGRYVTVGNQGQVNSATQINQNKQVTIYYSESEFPKSESAAYGTVTNEAVFTVELVVVSSALADLSVLNDEAAAAEDKAKALRQTLEAGDMADREMDEFIDIIWNILMDARNQDLGMPNNTIADRWITNLRKDQPEREGEFIILTASFRLTCKFNEQIKGEDLVEFGSKIMDVDIDLSGDDIEQTGVEVQTPQ